MTTFEAISLLVSFSALFAVFWQMRELRFQIRMNTYIEYTQRYGVILASFPSKVLENPEYSLEDCLKEAPEFKILARRYFWLLQEEYFVQKRGLVPSDQWKAWEREFVNTMRLKSVYQAWESLKREVAYPHEFTTYIDKLLAKQESRAQDGA